MPEGRVVVKDEKGHTIRGDNIWSVILSEIVAGRFIVDAQKIHVFIDGAEIPKPSWLGDDTPKGGGGID